MQSKHRWNDAEWDTIDFDLFGKHFKRLNAPNQSFQMKFSHDKLPLGKINLHRSSVKDSQVSLCPCCSSKVEDINHFLHCDKNTAPAIATGLRNFLRDKKLPVPHPSYFLLQHFGSIAVMGYLSPLIDRAGVFNCGVTTMVLGWRMKYDN
jgi:hypothetical protein